MSSHTSYDQAVAAWMAGETMRRNRRTFKQFAYGQQWDAILDSHTAQNSAVKLSEQELRYIEQRKRPLTTNLIRSLIKSVVGRFRMNITREERPAAPQLTKAAEINRLDELDARALEEFLISGCAIQRVVSEKRFDGPGIWVDNVNPSHLFCNRFSDPRGTDIRVIGMIHEMSLAEMCLRFGHGSRRRRRDIMEFFKRRSSSAPTLSLATADTAQVDFDHASDPSLCPVTEVWTLELDKNFSPVWRGRFFAPGGTLLDETQSPFGHRSHPFVVNFYPLIDGEVHPFIEDVIDKQRHINVLIATIDLILENSAKSVLLFPDDCASGSTSVVEAARLWGVPGAVIPVNPHATRMPEEITATGHSEGASQLLDTELRLFQQISGVTDAFQGRNISGTTSAQLYESQVENSAIAPMDIYESFNAFRSSRNYKILNISQ